MAERGRIVEIPLPPERPSDAHKGTFGTIIVIGGSETMIGAPALCAASALRSGVGLAKVATPASILPFVICIEPGATGILAEFSAEKLPAQLDDADPKQEAVLAVGPGLGAADGAEHVVDALLRGPRKVVLDADGLNALARLERPRAGEAPLVLTPHPGEFKRLAGPLNIKHDPVDPGSRPVGARALAEAHRAVVVLKGKGTVVTDAKQVYVNRTGNPALATAGSGDVLTGLTASLLAQGMDLLPASILAVYLHGRAADRWAQSHGPCGLTARDLADLLPEVLEEYRRAVA